MELCLPTLYCRASHTGDAPRVVVAQNVTRPDLIHIEGDRGRDRPRDPQGPPRQEAAGEGSSAVLEGRAPPPLGARMAAKDGPPCAGLGRAPGKASGRRLG